ncbi:hypothetical protein [Saccharicrinis sp. FJH54]|uniref:hypothetical protein n=1 Tax=Saccharicrinis sp. FJH54 TaxID=3344665 RepID=UPI0035D4A1DE
METEDTINSPNKDEINYKKIDYRERHRFWAGQTLSQFGNANNFFILIGFAIFGYLVKEIDLYSELHFTLDWRQIQIKPTTLVISLIFAFLSLFSGTLTMLSRLYDLRLTRHINTVRIKAYSLKHNYDDELPDDYIDIKKKMKFPKFHFNLLLTFLVTITNENYFLDNVDIENKEKRHEKFLKLRERALILGRFSWISFKWQIIWILLSMITFIIFWK